jgi:hypothetical protein
MDIDKILEKISIRCDKDKKYLKGLYNKAKKDLEEQFGDALNEDRIDMLSLIRIGKQYDITKDQIDEFVKDNTEKTVKVLDDDGDVVDDITLDDALDDLFDDDTSASLRNEIDDMGFETKKSNSVASASWKDFMDDTPEPSAIQTTDYERTPSLIVEIGCTYYIKMNDLDNPPYEHEFDGKWGPYTKWAFKIKLVKISDEDLYDKEYEYGEFKGKKAYVDGQNYTLWLNLRGRSQFGAFWKKLTSDGLPDGRTFTFKHTKPSGKNDFKFALPKKR